MYMTYKVENNKLTAMDCHPLMKYQFTMLTLLDLSRQVFN